MAVIFQKAGKLWGAYQLRRELGYAVLYDIGEGKVVKIVISATRVFSCTPGKGYFCLHVKKVQHLNFAAFVADAKLQVTVLHELNKLTKKAVKCIVMCLMKNYDYIIVVYNRYNSVVSLGEYTAVVASVAV